MSDMYQKIITTLADVENTLLRNREDNTYNDSDYDDDSAYDSYDDYDDSSYDD